VLRLLRRLPATSPAICPRLPHDPQAQPAVLLQQSPPARPSAQPELHPEQQAVPQLQRRIASPSAPAAGLAGVAALDQQAGQPGAAAGLGPAVLGSGTAAAAESDKGVPSSPAISLGSSGK
jgi:hypothetical protein